MIVQPLKAELSFQGKTSLDIYFAYQALIGTVYSRTRNSLTVPPKQGEVISTAFQIINELDGFPRAELEQLVEFILDTNPSSVVGKI